MTFNYQHLFLQYELFSFVLTITICCIVTQRDFRIFTSFQFKRNELSNIFQCDNNKFPMGAHFTCRDLHRRCVNGQRCPCWKLQVWKCSCFFLNSNVLPELKSHSRIDLSLPSESPLKRTFPSGSNFNNVTGELWPGNTWSEIILFYWTQIDRKISEPTCQWTTAISRNQVPYEYSRVFKASDDASVRLWNGERHSIARWFPFFEQCSTLQVINYDEIGWRILKLFGDDANIRTFVCYCWERCDELWGD